MYYYFEEPAGRTRTITGATGVPCNEADCYLFGGEQTHGKTCDQNYHFAGMYRDGETANDYTQFRMYESNLGRWMTPDPLGGDILNPQSLNRYAYVLNNPTNLIDPLGSDSKWPEPGWNPWGTWAGQTNSLGYPITCSLDGIVGSCWDINNMINAGVANPCPGNVCSSWVTNDKDQISYKQFQPTIQNPGNWSDVTPWMADPALPQNSPNYYDLVMKQRDYVVEGLRKEGRSQDEINAFLDKNSPEVFNTLQVEGGNVHFDNPGFNFGCPRDRCASGLDFSHGGGTFHRDTANPYNGPGSAGRHFVVDVLGGYFVYTIIPRQ